MNQPELALARAVPRWNRFWLSGIRAVTRAIDIADAVAQDLARRHREKQAIANLRLLPDGQLKDIGMHRSEIMSMVHARGNDETRRPR